MKKAFLFVAFIGLVVLQPFALVLINDWHIQPLFNTPDIGWIQAYAIGLIPSLYNYNYMQDVKQKPMGKLMIETYVRYGLIILTAWALQASL